MTTKADVLAAREAYERVAEAYLREQKQWYEDDLGLWHHRKNPWIEWTLDKAVFAETRRELAPDCTCAGPAGVPHEPGCAFWTWYLKQPGAHR